MMRHKNQQNIVSMNTIDYYWIGFRIWNKLFMAWWTWMISCITELGLEFGINKNGYDMENMSDLPDFRFGP